MTTKFDAFKAAYLALCEEHGAHVGADNEGALSVCEGPHPDYEVLFDETYRPLTPEEVAAQEQRQREEKRRHQEFLAWLAASEARIQEEAKRTMAEQMRVSTDPADPAFVDTRPRRAWCNDVEILDWVIADEFRRCVITADGKVHNGAVLIERLSDDGAPAAAPGLTPTAGFAGVFESKPEAAPAAAPAHEAPAEKPAAGKRRR